MGEAVALGTEGEFRKQDIANVYLEYGITDRLTFVGNLFYDRLLFNDKFSHFNKAGFSDQEVGLRYRLIQTPIIFSLQQVVKIPTGYNRQADLPLGNGQADFETRLLIGKEVRAFYFNGEIGYRVRTKEPPDEVRWQTLIGYKGINHWELSLAWNAIRSIGMGHPFTIGRNVLSTISFDLDRIDISAMRQISRILALEGGYFQHVAGRNTGGGRGFSVGFRLFLERGL